jgi:hypothetical protein
MIKRAQPHTPLRGIVEAILKTVINRQFIVNGSLSSAFDHISKVEAWPSWAKHIRRVELQPTGPVTAETQATLHLTNGLKTYMQMTGFDPPHSWEWTGKFLWLTISYDHRFQAVSEQQTQINFMVSAEGLGTNTIGRLFAAAYNGNLDTPIPNLIAEFDGVAER